MLHDLFKATTCSQHLKHYSMIYPIEGVLDIKIQHHREYDVVAIALV